MDIRKQSSHTFGSFEFVKWLLGGIREQLNLGRSQGAVQPPTNPIFMQRRADICGTSVVQTDVINAVYAETVMLRKGFEDLSDGSGPR